MKPRASPGSGRGYLDPINLATFQQHDDFTGTLWSVGRFDFEAAEDGLVPSWGYFWDVFVRLFGSFVQFLEDIFDECLAWKCAFPGHGLVQHETK
jgi:hypothetical protein